MLIKTITILTTQYTNIVIYTNHIIVNDMYYNVAITRANNMFMIFTIVL